MRNHLTVFSGISRSSRGRVKSRKANRLLPLLISLGLTLGLGGALKPLSVQAQTPETAPAALKNTLAQLDAAANSHNLQAVMQFYSPSFKSSDGLTRQGVEQSLTQLWQRYPRLNYRTELKSWQADSRGFVTETVTYITGVQPTKDRDLLLKAEITSKQRFENQKLVQQEILSETSQLTSGANPPEVEVKLPKQVRAGQDYHFDVIVKEPLRNNLLLGTAVEEPIQAGNYLNPSSVSLELLPAGGIFKIGRAPAKPDDRWISAVLVRESGMTVVTQRLKIVGNTPSTPRSGTSR